MNNNVIDQQLSHNDCGISAIKTVYNLFNLSISREYIKEKIHLDEKGSSFAELKTFFNEHGLEAKFKLVEFDFDPDNTKYLRNLTPFIIATKKRMNYIMLL